MASLTPIRVTERAQKLAQEILHPGDIAIDATAGKGRDAAFLAQCVGPGGHVHAFDIQPVAIDASRNLLTIAGLMERVTLHPRSHAEIKESIPLEQHGRVGAVLFNLGYLPGGSPTIITQPASTAKALQAARAELRVGGRIVCVSYTGHPGGEQESDIVKQFADQCEQSGDAVQRLGLDPNPGRPWVMTVTRNFA